jgi:O-antigen ligase
VLWGVVAAAALVPLAMDPWGFNPFGPAKAFVLAACALSVAIGLVLDRDFSGGLVATLRTSWIGWCVGALWFLIVLSTVVSIDPLRSIAGSYPEYSGVITWLAVTTIACGAMSLRSADVWPRLGRAVSVSLVLMGVYGMADLLGLQLIALNAGAAAGRVTTTLGNPSNVGVYMLLAAPLALERLRRDKSLAWRVTAGIAFALAVSMLLFSGSRGAWLGFVVGALLWMGIESRRWAKTGSRRKIALIAAAVVLAALVSAVLAVPQLRARFAITSSATVEWRFIAWDAAGHATLDRPLLGWGPDSFRAIYTSYWPTEVQASAANAATVGDPHNIFANAAASLGLPGALVLLGLVVAMGMACTSLVKARTDQDLKALAISTALAGGLVAVLFHYVTLDTLPLMAILTGLVVGAQARAVVPGKRARHVFARAGVVVVAGVLLITTLAAAGLVGADAYMRSALASAGQSPWTSVKSKLHVAQVLAPWEPTFKWAVGKAAVQALGGQDRAQAYSDGRQALEATGRSLPLEPGVAYDLAYLRLTEGLATHDDGLVRDAQKVFVALSDADANNPTYWSARGIAAAALGDRAEALRDMQTALVLAPNNAEYKTALKQLEQ